MLRYVVLHWSHGDPAATRTAAQMTSRLRDSSEAWTEGVAQDGLSVFYMAAPRSFDAFSLPGNSGIVLGSIYSMDQELNASAHSHLLDVDVQSAIRRTAGQSLVKEFWGSYILVLSEPTDATVRVVRGPMSDIPCYRTEHQRVQILFSFIDDCLLLGAGPFSVNLDYIRATVVFGSPRTQETALREVSAVEMGECLTFRQGTHGVLRREWYWDPVQIAQGPSISTMHDATAKLRAATRLSVHAMSSRHDDIALLLSGGIDSTIVGACLRSAPTKPRVEAFTYRFESAIGNETRYAQAAADLFGFPMTESQQPGDMNLDMLDKISNSPRPGPFFSGYRTYWSQHEFAKQMNATAIFSGSMGDAVFGRLSPVLATAEYVQRHGINTDLLGVAYNAGLREGLSIWHILRKAISIGMFNRPRGPWSYYQFEKSQSPFDTLIHERMVTPESRAEFERDLPRFVHPWLQRSENIPIGKLILLAILDQEGPCDNPFFQAHHIPVLRPLVTQPLVDCSLRIESPLNIAGGWDRSVARHAFSREAPPEVLSRNSKGSPLRSMRDFIDRNAAGIRALLLDGVLVREKLLDARQIESALPTTPSKAPVNMVCLMQHIFTEAWARRWIAH